MGTASTLGEASDWSVGTVWGAAGLDYYLLDVVRGRLEAPDLRRRIVEVDRHWHADVTITEDTELGRALLSDFRHTGALRPLLVRPRFDKEARLLAQSARFEAGQVHLPSQAEWLADYVGELLAFPNGRHDDQVDSTSQALHRQLRHLVGLIDAGEILNLAGECPLVERFRVAREAGLDRRRITLVDDRTFAHEDRTMRLHVRRARSVRTSLCSRWSFLRSPPMLR